MSIEHRSYWLDQAARREAFLREPALLTQTLRIARERLSEALACHRSLDYRYFKGLSMTINTSATSVRAERRTPLVQELRRENMQLREQRAKLAAL